MASEFLKTEISDGVAVVTLNRPEALNALNSELLAAIGETFTELGNDDNARVIILTGEGKAFAAGADIAEMVEYNAAQGKAYSELGMKAFRAIIECPKPVIAAVNGFALGGGCELAMSCDIRIASVKAKLGQPEITLAVTPGFGGTQKLPRLVGPAIAKELLFTGRMVKADEAKEIGLVNKVVEPEELMNTAMEMANKIKAFSPLTLKYVKDAVNQSTEVSQTAGETYESDIFGVCFSTEDLKEGMTAFLEKRKPEFKGK
ncbi:hypothetical protein DRQ36_08030 [bacterium]|nr:MAG: hypothetical protein DRQ36_08030 [bacterium]